MQIIYLPESDHINIDHYIYRHDSMMERCNPELSHLMKRQQEQSYERSKLEAGSADLSPVRSDSRLLSTKQGSRVSGRCSVKE